MFKNFKLNFGINRMMLLTSDDCSKEIRNVARNKMTDLVDVKLVNVKNIISSPYIGIRSDLLGVLGVTLKEKQSKIYKMTNDRGDSSKLMYNKEMLEAKARLEEKLKSGEDIKLNPLYNRFFKEE